MAVNRIGPPCPSCGHPITAVVTTARSNDGGFLRRRHCVECDRRFYTVQLPEFVIPAHVFVWSGRRLEINWQHSEIIGRLLGFLSSPTPANRGKLTSVTSRHDRLSS